MAHYMLLSCIACCYGAMLDAVEHCILLWYIACCFGSMHVAVVNCMLQYIACCYGALRVAVIYCILLWCIASCCGAFMLLWCIACSYGAMDAAVVQCIIPCCYGELQFALVHCMLLWYIVCSCSFWEQCLSYEHHRHSSTKYNTRRQQKKCSYHFQSYSSLPAAMPMSYKCPLGLASDQNHPLLNATNYCSFNIDYWNSYINNNSNKWVI